MRRIQLFISSSTDDLYEERLELGNYVRYLNSMLTPYEIEIHLVMSEDDLDEKIDESDYFFVIFYHDAQPEMFEQFQRAFARFKLQQYPKVFTYFKRCESPNQEVSDFMRQLDQEVSHYYTLFDHVDTIKLKLLLYIVQNFQNCIPIQFKDGKVWMDESEIESISLQNIPAYFNHALLKQLHAQLEAMEEKQDHSLWKQKQKCLDQIHQYEMELLKASATIVEMTSSGKPLSLRAKKAIEYLNVGHPEKVHQLLLQEERKQEESRIRQKQELHLQQIEMLKNETKVCIQAHNAQGITQKNLEEVNSLYEELYYYIETYHLEPLDLIDYVSFLKAQNRDEKAMHIVQTLVSYYKNQKDVYVHVLQMYGSVLSKKNDPTAIEYFEESIRLMEMNPTFSGPTMAYYYRNAALECSILKRYDQAIQYYEKSLQASQHPDIQQKVYSGLSTIYRNLHEYSKAIEYARKQIQILQSMPKATMISFVNAYSKLGKSYLGNKQYTYSIDAFKKAESRMEKLCQLNPERYEIHKADIYNELGNVYYEMKQIQPCELYNFKALSIREKWANIDFEVFARDLADTYYNIGNMYSQIKKDKNQAYVYYQKALPIREQLATKNPEQFLADLASSYVNLGLVSDLEHQLQWYKKALNIYEQLASKNPDAFELNVALCLYNIGNVCDDLKQYEPSKQAFQQATAIYEKWNQKSSGLYVSKTASCYYNAGFPYFACEEYEMAEKYWLKTIDFCQKNPGKADGTMKNAMNNLVLARQKLGPIYYKQKKFEQANQMFEYVWKIKKSNWALEWYAICQDHLDHMEQAESLYLQVIQQAENPAIRRSQYNLGKMYKRTQQYEKAKMYLIQARESYQQAGDEKMVEAIDSMMKGIV